eukprot:2774546-Prymnesium_polylepis.2
MVCSGPMLPALWPTHDSLGRRLVQDWRPSNDEVADQRRPATALPCAFSRGRTVSSASSTTTSAPARPTPPTSASARRAASWHQCRSAQA